jgi:hypothetical protein
MDKDLNYKEKIRILKEYYHFFKKIGKLGENIPEFIEFLLAPASKLLNKWFESEVLKGLLSLDATLGAYQSP